jgi:hypothetical protein
MRREDEPGESAAQQYHDRETSEMQAHGDSREVDGMIRPERG